jgi:diaminohydroxyphosphoribosylaminopyrimidine deaminase/5-amino-6-(5-phosphoribosylamino)uracil reductase
VLATGWHQVCGEAHAEVHALKEAGQSARGATAYVTLEPCDHQGRTPACVDALIAAGVDRVVCATHDPNPRINGNGFVRLEKAGIRVDKGLMKEQAESLNAGFFKRMRENMPWVRVKLAQSLDGNTALADGSSQWISSEASRADVQKWRARSSAVMTGIGTVVTDDPSLNVRGSGENNTKPGRQPLRIIVDSHWRTPPGARTLGLPGGVLIAGRQDVEIPESLKETGAEFLPVKPSSGRVGLRDLMAALANREINELQVEAGAILAGALLEEQLVDEVLIYLAPLLLGLGARNAFAIGPLKDMQQRISMQWIETVGVGSDLRLRLKPEYRKD